MTAPAFMEPAAEMAIIAPRPAALLTSTNNEDEKDVNKLDDRGSRNDSMLSSAASESRDSAAAVNQVEQESPAAAVPPTRTMNKKGSVTFATVRIHEHRLTLGDNPGVSLGVPLTLGWECDNSDTIDLEAFERLRCGDQDEPGERSPSKARRMCLMTRIEIASENHSRNSILNSAQAVLEIQKSRVASIQDRPEFMSQREERRSSTTSGTPSVKEQRVIVAANATNADRKEAKEQKEYKKNNNVQAKEERKSVAKVTNERTLEAKEQQKKKEDVEPKKQSKKKKAVKKVIKWLRQDKGKSKQQVQSTSSNHQDFQDI